MSTTTPVLLTQEQIEERFDLSLYDPIGDLDRDRVLFFDGDVTINGSFDIDWAKSVLADLGENTSVDGLLIVVKGNLTVAGEINIEDTHPTLLVMGNVHCDVLISGDDSIHITGDAHIKYVLYGHYNDGMITIGGTTYVPYVLNSNHHTNITPQGAVLINIFDEEAHNGKYDYTMDALPQAFIPEVFNKKKFDANKFIEVVKAGRSPFLPGAKSQKTVNEEELAAITGGNTETVTELIWAEKRCTAIPVAITRLKNLKKLDLSENNIREIPAAIGELENLEELYLKKANVNTISEAIGRCKKLRVLDLSGNDMLQAWPEAISKLAALEVLKIDTIDLPLPESWAGLHKLEEVSMVNCYPLQDHSAVFPEVLTQLKNLKRLDFRKNKIQELPQRFENIQTLEEFEWTGSSIQTTTFPDLSGLPNLKKLNISRHFHNLKQYIFRIPTLEHLALDRNKEDKEKFTAAQLAQWEQMAPEKDEAFRNRLEYIKATKKEERNGKFSYVVTPGITPEDLQNINKLPNLKWLDLSINELTHLPESFYELTNLQYLNLELNNFSKEEIKRIRKVFKKAEIKL